MLYRPNESATISVGSYPYATTNYVSCNAVRGAMTFTADDLK